MKQKLFMNAEKAAARLGLSLRHFRRLEEIKPIQFGTKYFYRVDDVERVAKERAKAS